MTDRRIDILLGSIQFDPGRVKLDSRNVSGGDIFVAVRGARYDGHVFINDVLLKGAKGVVCSRAPSGLNSFDKDKLIIVDDTRSVLGEIARKIFHSPAEKMKVYGITGTNGKTTTAFLIRYVLKTFSPCGLISTVSTVTGDDVGYRSKMTTPGVMDLNRCLSEMVASGKKNAVVEISSHALEQKRVWGIKLDCAVFTNISPEHLDYHLNMDAYLEAKSGIFEYLKPGGAGIFNADDPLITGAAGSFGLKNTVTFGITHKADVRAEDIRLSVDDSVFLISSERYGKIPVSTRLIGRHNVYNILAAAAALFSQGIEPDVIGKSVEAFEAVPGRLQKIKNDGGFDVYIDYAHTPDALENILSSLRPLIKSRIICVFGCGGDRDKDKRPVMGRIASEMSDYVVLTSDNPRGEKPEDILSAIEKGVNDKSRCSIIPRREDAISFALEMAEKGDAVIIAGKGHEDSQVIGNKTIKFDDMEVAGRILKSMGI